MADDTEKVSSGTPSFNVHESLIPKDGKSTSSFFVLLATVIVGALFTGVFTFIAKKGYLSDEQASTFRNQLIELLSDALPMGYLAMVTFITRAYIKVRGEVSAAKATALGQVIAARESANANAKQENL